MTTVTLIGTKGGPAIRQGGAMPTSSLIHIGGRLCIVDCGLGVTKGLVEAGHSLLTIDAVFITHLHSDHLLELGPILHTAWTTGLKSQIPVYGPKGLADYWAGFMASMSFDNNIRVHDEGRTPLDELIQIHEYEAGEVMAVNGLKVRALRVDHPPVTDCFALRFDADHSVTFSADTTYFPPLADFAKGSDILVHEAMLPEGVQTIVEKTGLGDALRQHLHNSHTTAADAGRIAQAAGVRHLVLHHLVPADDQNIGPDDWCKAVAPEWNGPLTIGHDGLTISL